MQYNIRNKERGLKKLQLNKDTKSVSFAHSSEIHTDGQLSNILKIMALIEKQRKYKLYYAKIYFFEINQFSIY